MRLKKYHTKVYMRELLRQPFFAAVFAFVVTSLFIHIKLQIEDKVAEKNSVYFRPAIMNAILVYGIVHFGQLEG